ncbi:MAG: MFS transporter, partial [Alphaproteobacteria bacterium]|nr:MFS transporter [Alphaproteobacteria bacterium]
MTHKAQTKAIPNPKPDSSIVSKGDGGLEIESEPEYTNIHRPLHGTRLVPPYCRKSTAAALIGNILEHYDSALYGFLAPILAPLFFPSDDLIISLMLAYALLPLGIISRIGGSLIFGRMGDKQGRKRALSLSIFGMAIITGSMGLLPTYDTVGMWAPAGLALCRILQGLFASGESLGGAQFLLEHHGEAKKGLLSSLYSASTILGILGASAAVVLLTYFSLNWRYLYGVGFMTGFA